MTIVPVMWSVLGVLLALTAAVYIYRSRLTRDEEDQIFLGEGFDNERAAQSTIVSKVNRIEPILKVFQWLVGAAVVFVIGYYILDIVNQFK